MTYPLAWRKSSYSADQGVCVELADTGQGIAMRNSNQPEAGTLVLSRAQLAALLGAIKAGQLDGMT